MSRWKKREFGRPSRLCVVALDCAMQLTSFARALPDRESPFQEDSKEGAPPAASTEFQDLAKEISTTHFTLRVDETSFGMGIETGIFDL